MSDSELVSAKVARDEDTAQIRVEVTRLDPGAAPARDEEIGIPEIPNLERVWEMISQISGSIWEKLAIAKAKKATVEFGIEIGLEAGQLTAMLVKGTGKANIKITLEWS